MIRQVINPILDRTALRAWARIHTGRRLRVDMSNTVGRSIYLRKRYEPDIEAVLRDHLGAGDVFFDAGANVGYFSLVAADIVGLAGHVVSIEPNIQLYRLLTASVGRNGLADRWSIVPTGLGAEPGLEKLQIQRSSGISFIGATPRPEDKVVDVQITPIMTLDAVMSGVVPGRLPKLVKIDVEGLELHVLKGARKILEARQTHFVIEHSRDNQARFDIAPGEIAAFLEGFGYLLTPVEGKELNFHRHPLDFGALHADANQCSTLSR